MWQDGKLTLSPQTVASNNIEGTTANDIANRQDVNIAIDDDDYGEVMLTYFFDQVLGSGSEPAQHCPPDL